MGARTTVAIDESLRKRIKKLSAILDVSQGDIIENAISDFERKVLHSHVKGGGDDIDNIDSPSKRVEKLFEAATKEVWASDPEIKAIQQKLLETPGTIDDFIIDTWDSGLDQ